MRAAPDIDNNVTEMQMVGQIFHFALKERPTAVIPVEDQGNVNRAYDVTSGDAGWIVRVRFGREETRQFIREKYCADVIRAQHDWIPEVVAVGTYGGNGYSIQRKIVGTVAARYSGDMVSVWEQVGSYAAYFHGIRTPGYLNDMLEKHADVDCCWCKPYFDSLGAAKNSRLVSEGLLTEAEFDRALDILRPLEDLRFEPTLAHGDLSPKNIMIDQHGMAHIIDWGTCQGHMAAEFDLSVLLALDIPERYVKAYLRGHGMAEDSAQIHRELLERLQLVRCLMNAHWLCQSESPRKTDMLVYVEKTRQRIAYWG